MNTLSQEQFFLSEDYIELCNVLKICGPHVSGGEAKHLIAEGQVTVDGQVELRKKCKIRAGQKVQWQGYIIEVLKES